MAGSGLCPAHRHPLPDSIHPTDGAITNELATALFRIVQEALTNALRHAGARRVDIELGVKSGCVMVEINDDGTGITESAWGLVRSAFSVCESGLPRSGACWKSRRAATAERASPHGSRPDDRILVVDDHALVRRGLIELLQGLPDGVQFGEAGTAAEAIALVFGERWDVVLLDLGLPDRHGLEVLREVHAARPHLPVLVLTMFPEDQLALRMLEMGASGYLTKESAPEELLRALERVMTGHKYLSPAMAQAVADGLGGPPPAPHEQLLRSRARSAASAGRRTSDYRHQPATWPFAKDGDHVPRAIAAQIADAVQRRS